MVRAEPRNNHTGIDTNHSTMFTLLLELNVIFEQRWVQLEFQNSPSRVLDLMTKYTLPLSKPVKSDHNSNFWYFQNNNIETTKLFSVGSSPDPPISKKIAVRSSPDPAKIGFSLDPVRSSTDRCSSLLHTWQEVYRIRISEFESGRIQLILNKSDTDYGFIQVSGSGLSHFIVLGFDANTIIKRIFAKI